MQKKSKKMSTATKPKKRVSLNGTTTKNAKKLTKKQVSFVEQAKKVQEMMSELYNQGKISVYDPAR